MWYCCCCCFSCTSWTSYIVKYLDITSACAGVVVVFNNLLIIAVHIVLYHIKSAYELYSMTKCMFYLSAFCCRGRTVKRRFSCVSARQQECCKYERMTSREADQLKPFTGNPLPFSDSVTGLVLKSVFPWVLIFIHHHDVARFFYFFLH